MRRFVLLAVLMMPTVAFAAVNSWNGRVGNVTCRAGDCPAGATTSPTPTLSPTPTPTVTPTATLSPTPTVTATIIPGDMYFPTGTGSAILNNQTSGAFRLATDNHVYCTQTTALYEVFETYQIAFDVVTASGTTESACGVGLYERHPTIPGDWQRTVLYHWELPASLGGTGCTGTGPHAKILTPDVYTLTAGVEYLTCWSMDWGAGDTATTGAAIRAALLPTANRLLYTQFQITNGRAVNSSTSAGLPATTGGFAVGTTPRPAVMMAVSGFVP